MTDLKSRIRSFSIMRQADEAERERVAVLNGPPPKNDPALLTPVRVRVVRPFCILGERKDVGEIVTLQRHDALSMAAIGRCEIL